MTIPCCDWVAALKDLQNSMMFTPRWPSAGPTGGLGLAWPAGICSFTSATTFFAISRSPRPARTDSGLFHLHEVELDGCRAAEDADQDAQLALLGFHLFHDA